MDKLPKFGILYKIADYPCEHAKKQYAFLNILEQMQTYILNNQHQSGHRIRFYKYIYIHIQKCHIQFTFNFA